MRAKFCVFTVCDWTANTNHTHFFPQLHYLNMYFIKSPFSPNLFSHLTLLFSLNLTPISPQLMPYFLSPTILLLQALLRLLCLSLLLSADSLWRQSSIRKEWFIFGYFWLEERTTDWHRTTAPLPCPCPPAPYTINSHQWLWTGLK